MSESSATASSTQAVPAQASGDALASSAPSIERTETPQVAAPVVVVPSVPGGRRYSTLVMIVPQFEGETLEGVTKDLRAVLEAAGVAIISADSMGRRVLAYKIGKFTEGIYVNFVYSALPSAIALIERDLRHKETIMRFLTTVEQ
ncbi:MAG: 30S ribosomal protein S6 [Candidatus Hydrogenedentota bacterium]